MQINEGRESLRKRDPFALGCVSVAGCLGIGTVMVICGLIAQVTVAMAFLQVRGVAQSVLGCVGDIGDLGGESGESRSGGAGPGAGPTVVLRLDAVGDAIEPSADETPGPTPTRTVHTVESGEALSLIAERYGVSVREILQANDLENPDNIFAGQQLLIPSRR